MRLLHNTVTLFRFVIVASILSLSPLFSLSVWGQEAIEILDRNKPIPKHTRNGPAYQSWSLFLISNPAWLLEERREDLESLYWDFKAFGRAIGDNHAAVWFWRDGRGLTPDNVDVERSSRYCAKFNLLPSEGPHILVTTTYPDLDAPAGDYYVLKLNAAKPTDITILLGRLADQVLVEGLDQWALDSEQYWRAWARIFKSAGRGLASFIKKVTLTVDTKFFKVEIEGGLN
jgi:hypothetical protein